MQCLQLAFRVKIGCPELEICISKIMEEKMIQLMIKINFISISRQDVISIARQDVITINRSLSLIKLHLEGHQHPHLDNHTASYTQGC